MGLVQEQQYLVTATLDGAPIPGAFDSFEGGEVDSEAKGYRAGGMADSEALPGVAVTGEVTIGRGYRSERDAPLEKWLYTKIGAAAVIGKQALLPNKQPVPNGLITYRGVLKSVNPTSHDSEGDDVAKFELVFVISGLPA